MSTNLTARAWADVRADALASNFTTIREAAGSGAGVMPLVKADAYGLGLDAVVDALEGLDPWGYGVATVPEGVRVRTRSPNRRVVVVSPTPSDHVAEALDSELELSVSDVSALEDIAGAAAESSRVADVHLDLDTGMGRSGFDVSTVATWGPEVTRLLDGESARWAGTFTHLHSADEDAGSIDAQWGRFEMALRSLDAPDDAATHILNSPGVHRRPQLANTVVRPGIFLYGGRVGPDQPDPEPVLSLHARVVHVREATPGTTLGYGSTHVAKGDERWATLSIGYGDGLPRALSNKGEVLLNGRRVPIIGRISMDVTVVDITDHARVDVGDVATLIGSDGDETISVDDVAELAGTISYEILTGLTCRIPRRWLLGGTSDG